MPVASSLHITHFSIGFSLMFPFYQNIIMNNISFDQCHKTFNELHAHVINGIFMVCEYVPPINANQAYFIDTSMCDVYQLL